MPETVNQPAAADTTVDPDTIRGVIAGLFAEYPGYTHAVLAGSLPLAGPHMVTVMLQKRTPEGLLMADLDARIYLPEDVRPGHPLHDVWETLKPEGSNDWVPVTVTADGTVVPK